jgi:hypothetical protein
MKCTTFNNFFFNVANWDSGRTWSTPWVIDDPKVFVIPPEGQAVAQLYRVKKSPRQRSQKQQQQQITRNRSLQQPDSVDRTASPSRGNVQR